MTSKKTITNENKKWVETAKRKGVKYASDTGDNCIN